MSQTEQLIGRRTTDIVRKVAENKLRISVPDSTVAAWFSLARTIRIADDLVDGEPNEELRRRLYGRAISYLSENSAELGIENTTLQTEMAGLKSNLDSIPSEQRAIFIRNLRLLLRVTEMIRRSSNPSLLARLTSLEGQITARLYISLLPQEFSQLRGYKDYVRYFSRLSRTVNALDTIIDLPMDYLEGRTSIPPTIRNRLSLAASAVPDALYVISRTGPSMIKMFGLGSSAIIGDKNGDSRIHFKFRG